MPGIENAYVIYDSDTKSGLSQEKIKTASANVKPLGSTQLNETQVSSIRYLVAGSFAGLKPESVTVTDLNGRTYHGDSENGGSADDDPYLARKRSYEQDLKTKILSSLSFIPNVTVEPTVILDPQRRMRTMQVKRDPKAVPVRETEQTSTRTQEGAAPAGRPGLQAQQPNASASLATAHGGGSKEDSEESKHEIYNLTSDEQIEKETVGLTPRRVTVSVGIPSSYFEKVWQERNPLEEGKEAKKPDQAAINTIRQEESTKIQKHVAALLPPVEGVNDLAELVIVTTFQDIKMPAPPMPGTGEKALSWLGQYWTTLGMIGLALMSLLVLRSMVKSGPHEPQSQSRSLPAVFHAEGGGADEDEAETPQAAAAKRLRRFQGSGRSLRDELSEMVQEDPDVAANILKSWIGHVG
jgi:flagellar M-ring protein FliF